jgi:hypothetical protein
MLPTGSIWTACLALILCSACTYPTDVERFARNLPPFALVQAEPGDGAMDQPQNLVIKLRFTDFPDPASLIVHLARDPRTQEQATLRLLSGSTSQPLKDPEIDLVGRQVLLRPEAPLPANTEHTLELPEAVRALSGAALPKRTLRFRTGQRMLPADPAPPALTIKEIFGEGGVLLGQCTLPECHDSGTAARGLDLTQLQAAARYLTTTIARGSPERLKLVEPGQPARSYLLRKLLGWSGFTRIEGAPMPFDPTAPEDPRKLPDDSLKAVQQWIQQGAQP